MHRVSENLICFAIYAVVAGMAIPVIDRMPPQQMNDWLGWVVLPFALLPCVALLMLRWERVDAMYRYLVAVSLAAIALAFGCKVIGWMLLV